MQPADTSWATNRDIVESALFALSRPRHMTISSLVLDPTAEFPHQLGDTLETEEPYRHRHRRRPWHWLGCAERFCADGANVVIADIQDAAGEAAAKSIGATYIHCDVSNSTDVNAPS